MAPATYFPVKQSLIAFMNFNAINLVFNIAPRSGRSSTPVIEQTIDAVRKIIDDDPHSMYQRIKAILGISSAPINSISHDYLNLRKVSAR